MNSPKNPQPLQRSPERGVRPGFILALSSLLATVLFSVWLYQRPKSPPTPSTEEVVAVAAPARTSSASTPRVATLKRSATDVHPMRPVAPAPTPAATLEERWGIQVCSMRLSMGNSIVDLRYKILNAEKAALLANGKTQAYIVQPTTGTKLLMPTPPKEGAFPPTAHKLAAGKTYFAMVSNQRGALRSGDHVSVVIGDSLATNLTIE